MKKILTVGTDTLLLMAKNLKDRGEISKEQYNEMVQRNKTLPKDIKYDVIELSQVDTQE